VEGYFATDEVDRHTVFSFAHPRCHCLKVIARYLPREVRSENALSIRSYHIRGMRLFSLMLCLLKFLEPGVGRGCTC